MKAERKFLAHYLDSAFDPTYAACEYVRLGKDLEEFVVELNPDVETSKNILGENSVKHNGYEASTDADPVYYEYDDALTEKMMEIAMLRQAGDTCKTSYVEVLLKPGVDGGEPTVIRAVREDVYVIPNSYGGDTSGVQVPFSINYAGNRTEGTFDIKTKKFTANSGL
jgi:hypothetical protein